MKTPNKNTIGIDVTKIELMKIKLDRLLDRASALKVAKAKSERKANDRRKFIVGHLALNWAQKDRALAQRLLEGLYAQTLDERDHDPIVEIVTALGGNRTRLKFVKKDNRKAESSNDKTEAEEATA